MVIPLDGSEYEVGLLPQ